MTTIYLYGEMADLFGPVWKLAVSSVGEAIRAIEANRPGVIAYLEECGKNGVDFNVKINDRDQATETDLRVRRKIDTIKISPVVAGSKDKWATVIVAVVMIIVAVAAPELFPALQGPVFGIAGSSYASMIGMMGVSMLIGGVAQLMAKNPQSPTNGTVGDGEQNYLFAGPENTTTQGGPVPLCYGGPILVGSQVVSAGIYSDEVSDTYYPPDPGPVEDPLNPFVYWFTTS